MKTFKDYLKANGKYTLELYKLNQNTRSWDEVIISVEMTDTDYIISHKGEDTSCLMNIYTTSINWKFVFVKNVVDHMTRVM